MQNVCNTNSRILIQQSDKFIFLGILVLALHPAPDYACGVWPYTAVRPTTPEAVYTSHKTATESAEASKSLSLSSLFFLPLSDFSFLSLLSLPPPFPFHSSSLLPLNSG